MQARRRSEYEVGAVGCRVVTYVRVWVWVRGRNDEVDDRAELTTLFGEDDGCMRDSAKSSVLLFGKLGSSIASRWSRLNS